MLLEGVDDTVDEFVSVVTTGTVVEVESETDEVSLTGDVVVSVNTSFDGEVVAASPLISDT